jgi:hypothetical protein
VSHLEARDIVNTFTTSEFQQTKVNPIFSLWIEAFERNIFLFLKSLSSAHTPSTLFQFNEL